MGVRLDGLSKRYGTVRVLSRVSISFALGERVLLLGKNGAGKSTLLRACGGLLRPDSGSIIFEGEQTNPFHAIGYVGHQPMLYADLSIEENLSLGATVRGIPMRIEAYLKEWQLEECASRRIRDLSKGQVAKAAIAGALIHAPRFIFLDEPTSSLDDAAARMFLERLSGISDSMVVIASHDISRVREFCNRVVLLENGLVVADSAQGEAAADVIERYRRGNR